MCHISTELCDNWFISFYRATLCVSAVFAVARCLSVMLVHCTQTAEDIVKLLVSPVAPSF